MTKKAAVAAAVVVAVALVVLALRREAPKPIPPAASASASASASPVVLPPGRATVIVYDDGRPAADSWVVFHDNAGAVLAVEKSGKDGRATGPVGRGSMISVANRANLRELFTVQDVEPNDEIIVGEMEEEEGQAITACTARVSIPGPHPEASRYLVSLGVGKTEMPNPKKALPMPVLRRFIVDGKFPVLVEAVDAGGKTLAFTYARPSQCSDGGTPTVRGSAPDTPDALGSLRAARSASLEVSMPAWSTDYRHFMLVVSGGAAAAKSIAAELAIASGEDRFDRGRRESAMGGSVTFPFDTPRPLGTKKVSYKLAVTHEGTPDRSVLFERRETMPEQIEVDLRGRLLPRIESATLEPKSAPGRPAVRFRIAGAEPKADAIVVRLVWPSTQEHVWTILAPPPDPERPNRLVAPALPEELAAFRPDGRPITVTMAIVEASFFDGYRDVRHKGLSLLADPPEAPLVVIRYSAFGEIDF